MSSPGDWGAPADLSRLAQNPRAILKVVLGAVVLIFVLWFVFTCYYSVKADEQAVLLRFGKDSGVSGPGLHFKLPFGVDVVKKVRVREVKREEFGFRTRAAGVQTSYVEDRPDLQDEARILTGDLNILMFQWVVRYKVKDIRDYLFNVRAPSTAVRDVSEAVMRTVVGDSSVDEALTVGRARIQEEAKVAIQDRLDRYSTGIQVVNVRLKDVTPPEKVKEAFNAVNRARQQKERIINEAEAERNSKIPEARGQKQRTIEEARGYAQKRVNEAEGDVAHFLAVLDVYQQSPEVTERRLYLETISEILPKVENKYIIDSETGDVLKFLNLGGLAGPKGGAK